MKNDPASPITLPRCFPTRALAAGVALTIGAVAVVGYNGWYALTALRRAAAQQRCVEDLRANVAHLDDMLAMSVRLAAATGESVWRERYQTQLTQRENVTAEALRQLPAALAVPLSSAYALNHHLVQTEAEAFLAIEQNRREQAAALIFSELYLALRQQQWQSVARGAVELRQDLDQQLDRARDRAYLVAAISMVTVVGIAFVWVTVLTLIRQHMNDRTRAEAALQAAHDELELRVAERTANLQAANEQLEAEITHRQAVQAEQEKLHRQLVEASRRVGMAEVATGVLHNVGNVLNSVNVSASVIGRKLRESSLRDLGRVVALVEAHETDLAEFIRHDPKGRHLPRFLLELGRHAAVEQEQLQKELDGLCGNIDHIKSIVTMQQTHARAAALSEPLPLSDLVEDAIKMNQAALSRHDVRIVREPQAMPTVIADRHHVLQILVNLIANAKHAVQDCPGPDRTITIRTGCLDGDGGAFVEVIDNGVGIAAENLERIFAHGFTTRRDGHGFGLHSCALAARQINGRLTADSGGPGRGATFRLELPTQAAEVSA